MDDSDFVGKSLEPTRKLKCKLENGIAPKAIIESDYLLPDSDKNRCYVCNKDLKHLDELRRSLHINNCLDQQEAQKKYETKKEKWKKIVDCPICGESLEPGPFRAAHAKRCGKKHNVNGNSLLLLLDTQSKVAEMKKQNGIAHTKSKEPKLEVKKRPNRFKEEPRSLFDDQMQLATALSASINSSGSELYIETQEPPEVRPKKQRPRSFSFVELEPRACKCAVIERVQENFLNIFKTRDEKQNMRASLEDNIRKSEMVLKDTGACLRKLSRLEQLADDLTRHAECNNDITLFSLENEAFPACRFIIAARAPALLERLNIDGSLSLREYSGAAIRSYLCFLTSASMIWTEKEREEVHSLAMKYGPVGLAALCQSTKVQISSVDEISEKQPEISVDEDRSDPVKVSNEEKTEEIGVKEVCSNAEVDSGGDEKEEKAEESDDSSVIFIDEKISQNNDIVKTVKNACSLLTKNSENLSRVPLSGILCNKSNEILSETSGLSYCLSPKGEKSETEGNSEFLEKEHDEVAEVNDSLLAEVRPDEDAPISSSPVHLPATPNPELVDHFNDSIESMLRKLSPIKPLSLNNDEFPSSSSACCSNQLFPEGLLGSQLSEKPHISSNLTSKFGKARSSRKSLVKTKSTPAVSSVPSSESASLSPLSLLDQASACRSASLSPAKKRTRVKAVVQEPSTPVASTSRIVRRLEELGSNVKVVKTKDITPMPNYDLMSDKELKAELAKFGIRPMGKKRGTALLRRIYEETHPVLESTPLSRKSKAAINLAKRFEENRSMESDNDEDCYAERTLNETLDEFDIMEESYIDEESAVLPKDLDGMQCALVQWLRKEENSSLYNHLLGLNVISFEEFADRLSRADSAVSQIPKKALIEILDRLHVTFRLPMDGWERKRKRVRK